MIAIPRLLISILDYLLIFLGFLLMGLVGSLLGLLLSSKPTDQTSDIMVLTNLVKFPLLFLGGVSIPLKSLTTLGSVLNLVSPLTYLTELLRKLNEVKEKEGNVKKECNLAASIQILKIICFFPLIPNRDMNYFVDNLKFPIKHELILFSPPL